LKGRDFLVYLFILAVLFFPLGVACGPMGCRPISLWGMIFHSLFGWFD
jgi:hypothetical protein